MHTKSSVKRLSDHDLAYYRDFNISAGGLTDCRLAALKKTKAIKPNWTAFDPFLGEYVNIDIRLEEQYAVLGEYESQIKILTDERDRRLGLNQTLPMKL